MNIYHLLSRRNDLRAIIRGRLPQRIIRRHIYKHAFKAASFVTRLLGVGR